MPNSSVDQHPLLTETHNSLSPSLSPSLSNSHSQETCNETDEKQSRSGWMEFDGVKEARSVAIASIARGFILVSAIFISSSILNLARISAGCNDVLHTCNNKILGFKPSSLVTMITFVSGILTAVMMPIIGSLLEFTAWRRTVGIMSAFLVWMLQTSEIFTNKSTWFLFAIVQSISGFLYNVQLLTLSSYLPHIGRKVGEERMADYSAIFNAILFISCMFFLMIVNTAAAAAALKVEDIKTVQVSQFLDFLTLPPLLLFAWKYLPPVPAQQDLEPDQPFIRSGFLLMWDTAVKINVTYKDGLRFFFLATIFAEAGMSAFNSISLVYMIETLGASSFDVSILFPKMR